MRIAIVGGGPAGLGAAKALGKEPANFDIDLFEFQSNVGGLWNYFPENKNGNSAPANNGYVTAIYREMETNIIKDIMQYNDFPFPQEEEPFPTRQEVAQYLHDFSKTIENVKIHLNSEVTLAKKSGEKWHVEVHNHKTNENSSGEYDVLLIANGHFRTPFIPKADGLEDWRKQRPESVIHAKFYDRAEAFRDKRVLVVGNSASGIDISTQISTVASQVYLSSRKVDDLANLENPYVENIGVVASYNPDDSITLADGRTIKDIDLVIFCTGYLYDVPFLADYQDDITLKNENGFRNLYRGLFYNKDPSLVFIALHKQISPFPFAEAQGVYVARILNNRLKLPSQEERIQAEKDETAEFESDDQYQLLGYPKDIDYINELINIVLEINDGLGGHEAQYWDEKRRTAREVTLKVKEARLKVVLKYALGLRAEGKEFAVLRGQA